MNAKQWYQRSTWGSPQYIFSCSSKYPHFALSQLRPTSTITTSTMARLVLLLALCVLPALVAAVRPIKTPMEVVGRVYCDTCRAGFETPATTYIAGAKVKVECKHRITMQVVYTREGVTDSSGTFKIPVGEDHGDEVCDAVLISSPKRNCATVSPGRERARVILTSSNGISSPVRFANAMGFMQDELMSGCSQVMQQYQLDDDQV